jgi:2-methylcitrate dehydratase PrpD
VVGSPEIQAMIAKIHYGVDPVAEADGYAQITTTLKLTLNDGRTISSVVKFAKGSPSNPLSYDEVAEKFMGCAAFADWSPKKAAAIVSLVRRIEDVPDVSVLTDLCVL